jgi:hypothetical protein
VLGNAARAVRGRAPRRHRWVVGLGSAAGLVLAAGIAWHVGQDALRQQSAPLAEKPAFVPVQPISEDARKRHAATTDAAPAADALAPGAAPAAQAVRSDEKPKSRAAARKPAAEAVPDKEQSRAPLAPAASAPAPPPPPPSALAPAAPTPMSTPFPAGAADQANGAGAGAAGATRNAAKQEADAATAAEPAMRGAAPAPSGSAELRRDTQLAPEDWLAHIRQLLQQGRRQQAVESLRLFRRMHPDWAISDEWRRLSD